MHWPSCKIKSVASPEILAIQLPISFERALKEATADVKAQKLTRTEILEPMIKSGEIYQACKKSARNSGLQEDLFQEVIETILVMDEEKFMDIYQRGSLRPYIASMIYKKFNLNEGFYRKYRTDFGGDDFISDIPDFKEEQTYSVSISEVKAFIEKKNYQTKEKNISRREYSNILLKAAVIFSPYQKEPEYHTKLFKGTFRNLESISKKNHENLN